MTDIDRLPDEELKKLLEQPLTEEEEEEFKKIERADRWLLALNLRLMEDMEMEEEELDN